MSKARPAISDGMKYRALQQAKVLVQCVDCVAEMEKLLRKGVSTPLIGDKWNTWHALDAIEYDHVWELADDGEHSHENLRPRCIPHHKIKSRKAEKMRHHLDRAGKKHRGTFVKKPSRPIPKRPFPDSKRPFPSRLEVRK